jgi:threonine dehydrogenase-like Zn-dependent dehydrogenase
VVPFCIACGVCWFCERGLPVHCERSNPRHYGPEGDQHQRGGGLFGYTDLYGGYDGGQAEFVRVPFADVGPRRIPEALTDEEALFLSDIFPTGFAAIDWAHLHGGETVAIFGAGPVGIMAAKAAWLCGAGRVFVVDRLPYRLRRAAAAAHAEAIDLEKSNAIHLIRDLTRGRGADVCVDAVGMEAHHNIFDKLSNAMRVQAGSLNALKECFSAVRRGGTISILGVYGPLYDNFPLGQMFDKGIRIAQGQAPVHHYIDHLLDEVLKRTVRLDDVVSHHLPLSDAPRAYRIFNDKEEDCLKVVLRP